MYAPFIKKIIANPLMIIKKFTIGLLLTSLILGLTSPANAAKKDLNQEITIKSKRQSADLKNKIASYLDDVSITQGSISIVADIVQVYSNVDDETGKKFDTYLAKGQPAIFKQQLEDGSLISLQANEIKYQPEQYIITVSGNAQVKQAGSKMNGDIITYNTLNEKLEGQSNNDEHVTTILQPAQIKAQQDNSKLKKKKANDSNNK
ncbi:MAG: lipopolysaccharide export system protein LptA [Colwellia sp.]|jgi:lipopolysaccharide export system protein LptA|tara:strand:+ start:42898 stop:43512 length:615 start_codon:yes stop_codon:yes gene_type:complete